MLEFFVDQSGCIGGYMPTIQEFEKWITTGDAASELGKSIEGIKWMLRNRRLRGVHTRLGWLVDPEDVKRHKGSK
jgi:hypothetical protein